MDGLDYNKLISEIITSNIENLFESSASFFSDKTQKLKVRLKKTFSDYLIRVKRKYSTTKTIIYRDTPQSIEKFYEPLDLVNDTLELSSPTINDLLALDSPIIITGTGGSGKSTLLKYLLLNAFEKKKKIPIFIELRDVESASSSLIDFITTSLQLSEVNLKSSYLDIAFKRGGFIFFFDGFDELSNVYSSKISKEIELLTEKYTKCNFIVTSRPGQEFIAWNNFIELKTKPLTLKKAISLIKRLNFDNEVKMKFIKELELDLYSSHKSFFQNPLLLSIMLITYRDSASIPSELHNFYSLAFEALFYRHDASKSFKRPTMTKISVSQGKEILSAFCLITYLKTKTSFNKHELKIFLSSALKLSNNTCEITLLITDLLRAFCMLLQDGTVYTFTHRSFQEYFAALYLVNANHDQQDQLIKEFCKKIATDITLQLAYGMNRELIEDKLIFPFLEEMIKKIGFKKKLTKTVFIKFSKNYFDTILMINHNRIIQGLQVGGIEPIGPDSNKMLHLTIMKFLIKIYNINVHLEENKKIKMPLLETTADRNISIIEAFKNKDLLDWFFKSSIEIRVLNKLINIYHLLKSRKIENNDLFQQLLEK